MPKPNSATSTSNALNSNKQNNHSNSDNHDSISSGNSFGSSTHSHGLSKYQGQKWQQVFDVEKVLKQIRMAEKIHLKGKGGGSSGNDNVHKSFNSSNSSPPNKSRRNQIRQVQRLNGTDMHYYGIVPKQTALDVVVCSVCMGRYTKMGFNNHMMLQHPSVWTNVSAKITTPANDTTLGTNDSSQDSLKGSESTANVMAVTSQREVIGSPSDFSGTMSTCSNASSSSMSTISSSAAPAVNYVTPLTTTSRQKSSSKGGSSSGSSSSSRSRSKSKHHSSSTTASSSASSNANAEVSHSSSGATSAGSTSSKKSSSKKSSSSSSSNANSSSTATTTTNANGVANNNTSLTIKETAETSSSASPAINTTAVVKASSNMIVPSTVTVTNTGTTATSISNILEVSQTTNTSTTTTTANLFGSSSSSSSSSFSSSSSSSSSSSNSSYSLPPTPKMVVNNTAQDTQQITNMNSSVESTFSPCVLESKEKLSLTSSGECLASRKKKIKSPSAPFCLPDNVDAIKTEATEMRPLRMVIQEPPLNQYDDQISELDQAVSSITGGGGNGGSVSGNENKLDSASNILNLNTQSSMSVKIEQSNCGILNEAQQDMHQQHQLHTEEAQLVNNASDDSAMLNHVLDVMLDSKLINEILNAETELNFDENVLNDSSSTVNQHNTNHQQQQQAVYLDQPLTKRMRFDESANMGRLTSEHHEITGEYTVFPQQAQSQQHQAQDQFAQYNANPMSGTLNMEGHYQTPIDAMQLQQLLYHQQQQTIDSSTYADGSGLTNNHHQQHQQSQHQQIYDPNGATIVDTKQILELCGGTVGVESNGNELIKAEEFVTLPEDVSHQFQIFNVPSLTDDIEPEPQTQQQQITHHIVERQYVMPGHEETEEQFIYEITTNDSMSQQHQQQVLAEFLNQAASSYEEQQHQQLQQQVSHHQQQQHAVSDNSNKLNQFYDEFLDFDFSMIETVKSLTSSSSSSASHTNVVKSERDLSLNSSSLSSSTSTSTFKYHEDFYFNVFFYAGIPRPLAINCFGLIKLPQGLATTFRKHLLTTRKANNSLMSLSGGSLNGVVGQSSSASAAGAVGNRFGNAKQLPSYFTNLANNSCNSNSGIGNEFSIGSITITNAPSSNVQQQGGNNGAQQQQNKQNNSGGTAIPLEVNLTNINGGISATSPVSTHSRGRTKSGGSNHSSGSYNSTSSSNLKHKSVCSLANTANGARVTVGTIGPYNAKTIFVSSAAALSSEKNKFIKRSLIARVHQDPTRPSIQGQQLFTTKKLSDILSGKKPCTSANNSDVGNSSGIEMTAEMAAEKQAKLNRVNRFYERRRKLLNLTQQQKQQNHRHVPYQSNQVLRRQLVDQQLQPQQQQKILKQQLMRSFSDCGINSTSNTANVASADSNVMRVFV